MKIVKVEYQVKPEFIEDNKANIRDVMVAFKAKKSKTTMYSSYTYEEGKFMHITVTQLEDFSELTQIDEFKAFRQALKASAPIIPPKSYDMQLVGSSMESLIG